MLLLTGIIFFLGAFIMKKWPAKEINDWYGYRTQLSTSSEKAWQLAQEHSPKAMVKYSIVMMIVGLIPGYFLLVERYVPVVLIIELVILLPLFTVLMILSTHNYLKRTI